jgi:hypothetical protein
LTDQDISDLAAGPSNKRRRSSDKPIYTMHLTITPHNPINSTYRITESGVDQYKVQTEIKAYDSVTTISCRIDSDIPRRDEEGLKAAPGNERFGLLAQIHWRVAGPSMIEFGGRELDPTTFLENKSFGLFGW